MSTVIIKIKKGKDKTKRRKELMITNDGERRKKGSFIFPKKK